MSIGNLFGQEDPVIIFHSSVQKFYFLGLRRIGELIFYISARVLFFVCMAKLLYHNSNSNKTDGLGIHFNRKTQCLFLVQVHSTIFFHAKSVLEN